VEKIHSLFFEEEANSILVVPLLELVNEDKLIWGEENNGVYSVRSGYRLIMRERNKGYGSRGGDDWSSIWKIHAPPKAKHFLWRICKDCLPTRARLRNYYVQCPVECPLCLSQEEEEWHLLFDCEAIREAWCNIPDFYLRYYLKIIDYFKNAEVYSFSFINKNCIIIIIVELKFKRITN
jgi:hypothetical protein